MEGRQSFIRGAVVLAAAGAISRILGAIYRIPLARLVGGEGMGLYQMAYPIYTTILALATSGVPVAISVLVARKQAQGLRGDSRRILATSLIILAVLGLALSAIVFLLSRVLATGILREPRAALPIAAIAPAIFFSAVMSVFRGYFQGHQWMVPTAVSQVVEQVFRVTFVLLLAFWLFPRGLTFAAAGATFGAVIGGIAGMVVLLGFYVWFTSQEARKGVVYSTSSQSSRELAREFVSLAIPVSLGSVVIPLVQMLDAIVVPSRLMSIGFTTARATELYGELSGMASVLTNLPTIFTIAIGTSLVPAISDSIARGSRQELNLKINNGLRASMVIAMPSALGLYVLATQITDLLFKVPEAGIPLAVLSFSVIVLALFQISSSTLQGIGRADLPMRHLIVIGCCKVFFNYTLTGIPALNILGPCIGTVASFLVGSVLNFYYLSRLTRVGLSWARISKIAGAAVLMAVCVHYSYGAMVIFGIGSHLATLLAILAGCLVYPLFLLAVGELDRDLVRRFIKV